MSPAPRRKSYPNDAYTWMSAAALFFLLCVMAIVLYRLDVHYGFLGLFA